MRTFFCLVVLVVSALLVWTYYVYATPQNWDEVFHVRTSLVSPSDLSTGQKFRYSIDHPSIKRHVYRWVLHGIGVYELSTPDVDYPKGKAWNLEHGRVPPIDVSVALRTANMGFMVAALVLIFFTALAILRNPYFALLTAVPLLLSRRVAEGVVGYLGCDAILGFFLALSLFAWVILAQRGKASSPLGVIIIAAVAGLALSSKLNGGLVIVAYCLYLSVTCRGIRRLTMPLLAAAVCALVFMALNPVIWAAPNRSPLDVVRATLKHREIIWQSQFSERPMPRIWLVTVFFPYAAFIPAFVAAVVEFRKERWVLPVCFWAAVLVAGTLFTVNRTYARYYMPIDMAAFTAAGLLGWRLIGKVRGESAAEVADAAGRSPWRRAIPVAILGALVILTFVVAYEPLGPFRKHSERSVAAKVGLFYRQAIAYYGGIEQLDNQTVRERLTGAPRAERGDAVRERERPGLGPVRLMTGIAFAAACAFVLIIACRAVGWWAGAMVLAVLLWTQFAKGAYYAQTVQDKYFVFFAMVLLFGWLDLVRGGKSVDWRHSSALGIACGLCAAVSGLGIVLTGLTALLVALRGGRAALLALFVCVAAATFAALEPSFCYLEARGPATLLRTTIFGSAKYWPMRGAGEGSFLAPFEYYFPWLALLPLGAAVLAAARKYEWAMPLAFWSGAIIATTLAVRPATPYYASADANFALVIGSGLPAMAMLKRAVSRESATETTEVGG